MIVGLIVTRPVPELVSVSSTSKYWTCDSEMTVVRTLFFWVETCSGAIMLLFATFLAYKTRSAGKSYDHFNECKQMGISV